MGGGGMMGGYYNANGGLGAMMSSGNWSWMMGGAWQNMTRQDWQRLQHQLLGTQHQHASHHGWSMAAMIAAVLAGLVLVPSRSWPSSAARSDDRRRPRRPYSQVPRVRHELSQNPLRRQGRTHSPPNPRAAVARSVHPVLADSAGPPANGRRGSRPTRSVGSPRRAGVAPRSGDRLHADPATSAPSRAGDLATPTGHKRPRRRGLSRLR